MTYVLNEPHSTARTRDKHEIVPKLECLGTTLSKMIFKVTLRAGWNRKVLVTIHGYMEQSSS